MSAFDELRGLMEMAKAEGVADFRSPMTVPPQDLVDSARIAALDLMRKTDHEIYRLFLAEQFDLALSFTELDEEDEDSEALATLWSLEHQFVTLVAMYSNVFTTSNRLVEESHKIVEENRMLRAQLEEHDVSPLERDASPLTGPPPDMPGGASPN